MKQRQAEDDEKKEPSNRGRGRARGGGCGRGRGRGRGRCAGEKEGDENQKKAEPSAASSSKPKKPNPSKATEDSWAAWGTDGAWSQGWSDDFDPCAWAWDSVAWWEQQVLKNEFEFYKDSPPQKEVPVEEFVEEAKKPKKNEKKDQATKGDQTEIPEETKPKKKKEKKDQATKGDQTETCEEKEPKKKERKDQATKGDQTETCEEKEPKKKERKDQATKADQTEKGEEKNQKKRAKKDQGTKADQIESEKSTKKCKKQKEDEKDESSKEETSKKRKKEDANQKPDPDMVATDSPEYVAATQRRAQKIMDFMTGLQDMSAEQAQVLMRGRLQSFNACRMNIYWSRTAVGLHHRKQKVDFGYFKPTKKSCPSHFLMAAAMKAAEIVAACLFRLPSKVMIDIFDMDRIGIPNLSQIVSFETCFNSLPSFYVDTLMLRHGSSTRSKRRPEKLRQSLRSRRTKP